MCRDTFADLLRKGGELSPELVIGKAAQPDSETPVEVKGDAVTFVGTSSKLDRDNDIIAAAGVDFANWTKRPVILASHDARQRIAIGTGIERRGPRTIVTAEYYPASISPLAASMKAMLDFNLERKALKDAGAVFSVGFRSVSATWNDGRGGVDFKEIEVLEFSDVSMAANPAAVLLEAKAAGVDFDPWMDWTVDVLLKGAGMVPVDRDFAMRLRDLVDPSKSLELVELSTNHVDSLTFTAPAPPPVAKEIPGVLLETESLTAPVDLAFWAARKGCNATETKELMVAAGLGEFAENLSDPAGVADVPKSPAPEDDEAAWKEALDGVDMADILTDRLAAKTGYLPNI